jgi:hypothetical protein
VIKVVYREVYVDGIKVLMTDAYDEIYCRWSDMTLYNVNFLEMEYM